MSILSTFRIVRDEKNIACTPPNRLIVKNIKNGMKIRNGVKSETATPKFVNPFNTTQDNNIKRGIKETMATKERRNKSLPTKTDDHDGLRPLIRFENPDSRSLEIRIEGYMNSKTTRMSWLFQ